MQNTQHSETFTQLECIKKKIHKIKPHNEKLQNNIKMCPFPPGMQMTSQNLSPIKLCIPINAFNSKDIILEEQILWDFEDNFSDEQLFRNLFAIIIDLLEEKYPNKVNKLNEAQTKKIIEDCVQQVKHAIDDYKKYKYITEILAFETYIDKNDTLINLHIHTSKSKDIIQWDLENAYHFIDEFAQSYCYENKLEQENIVIIGNQIRDQIQKAFEKRFRIASKIINEDQSEFKQKLFTYLDYPSFEPYTQIKELPQNQELNIFFKKNLEFLPPDLQILYGQRPNPKQTLELGVDQEDTKKFEKEFSQKSKYLDQIILQDIINNKTKLN